MDSLISLNNFAIWPKKLNIFPSTRHSWTPWEPEVGYMIHHWERILASIAGLLHPLWITITEQRKQRSQKRLQLMLTWIVQEAQQPHTQHLHHASSIWVSLRLLIFCSTLYRSRAVGFRAPQSARICFVGLSFTFVNANSNMLTSWFVYPISDAENKLYYHFR